MVWRKGREMHPLGDADLARPLTNLEREVRDQATAQEGEFEVVIAAEGKVWLIDGLGRTDVFEAVRSLVAKGMAEPVGLPKSSESEPGEVRQPFRLS
jgi:hypothetical protein